MASKSQIVEKNRVWMRANLAQEYFVGGHQHGSGFNGRGEKVRIIHGGAMVGCNGNSVAQYFPTNSLIRS